jgi:hypothetical protein
VVRTRINIPTHFLKVAIFLIVASVLLPVSHCDKLPNLCISLSRNLPRLPPCFAP